MATKWKNEAWSVAAVIIGLFSLLYCFSFLFEQVLNLEAADLLAELRTLRKGDS